MNQPGTHRYTAAFSGVGLGPTSLTLTGPVGPFAKGDILRVEAQKTAGPATEVTFRFKEDAGAGRVVLEFTSESFPVSKQPLPAPYEGSAPTDLVLEIETDDGTNSTDIDFQVDIKGPN